MVAVPSPMAVTIPSGDTVATASSEDVHVASPAPSGRTVAVSCMVSPLLVKVAVAGDISTDCTSWVTVTSHVPLFAAYCGCNGGRSFAYTGYSSIG